MLAFVGGLIVIILLLLWANSSNAAEGGLGWGILLGFLFLLAIIGCTLIALILGITGCRAARQNQRWGWFVSFLLPTVLVVLGVLSFLLATYRIVPIGLSPAVALSLLIGPPLALVTTSFIYRREEA
jgi:energy-converting hydrogenase Eha subunit A